MEKLSMTMTTEEQRQEQGTEEETISISLVDREIISHELLGERYHEFFQCSICRLIATKALVPRHYFQRPAILSTNPIIAQCRSNDCPSFQVCLICGERSPQHMDRTNSNWWRTHSSSQNHQNAVLIFLESSTSMQGDRSGEEDNWVGGFNATFDNPFDVVDILENNAGMKDYFANEHEETGNGMRNLIARGHNLDDPKTVTKEEILFHAQALLLGSNITRSSMEEVMVFTKACSEYAAGKERERIHDSLLGAMFLLQREGNPLLDEQKEFLTKHLKIPIEEDCHNKRYGVFRGTKPPEDFNEYQRLFWTGANSLTKNLPIPSVHLTPNQRHAFVNLEELVTFYLALGTFPIHELPPAFRKGFHDVETPVSTAPTTSYYNTSAANKVREETEGLQTESFARPDEVESQSINIHMKEWDDDAEKNNTRSGTFSYHLSTVTFLTPRGNGDVRFHQFLIGISQKGEDYQEFHKQMNSSLEKLARAPGVYYDGRSRRFVKVFFNLTAGVRDRPAASEFTFTSGHGSTFGKRFGWSCYHSNSTKLIPCDECHGKRVHRVRNGNFGGSNGPTCSRCSDLDYNRGDILGVKVEDLSEKYPESLSPESPIPPKVRPVPAEFLEPVELTFAFLKEASWVAFYNYHYKRSRSCPENFGWKLDELKSYAKSCAINQALIDAMKGFSASNILEHPRDLKDKFFSDVVPACWKRPNCALDCHLTPVMHLCFHGITTDIWEFIVTIVTGCGIKKKALRDFMNQILSEVDNMRLLWCRVRTFGESKTGNFSFNGWYGNAKKDFVWVIRFIVSHFGDLVVEHASPTNVEDQEWGEKTSDRLGLVVFAVACLECVCVRILHKDPTPSTPDELLEYLKMFTYLVNKLDLYQRQIKRDRRDGEGAEAEKEKEPYWFATGNLLTALNIPDNIRKFGCQRVFYESKDELAVQKGKRALPNINFSSPRWRASILEKAMRNQSLDMIFNRESCESAESENFSKNAEVLTISEFRRKLMSRKPFSLSFDRHNNQLYSVCWDYDDAERINVMCKIPVEATDVVKDPNRDNFFSSPLVNISIDLNEKLPTTMKELTHVHDPVLCLQRLFELGFENPPPFIDTNDDVNDPEANQILVSDHVTLLNLDSHFVWEKGQFSQPTI